MKRCESWDEVRMWLKAFERSGLTSSWHCESTQRNTGSLFFTISSILQSTLYKACEVITSLMTNSANMSTHGLLHDNNNTPVFCFAGCVELNAGECCEICPTQAVPAHINLAERIHFHLSHCEKMWLFLRQLRFFLGLYPHRQVQTSSL